MGFATPLGWLRDTKQKNIIKISPKKKGASGVSLPPLTTNIALVGKAVGHTQRGPSEAHQAHPRSKAGGFIAGMELMHICRRLNLAADISFRGGVCSHGAVSV